MDRRLFALSLGIAGLILITGLGPAQAPLPFGFTQTVQTAP
jgi:hypothetical protein